MESFGLFAGLALLAWVMMGCPVPGNAALENHVRELEDRVHQLEEHIEELHGENS